MAGHRCSTGCFDAPQYNTITVEQADPIMYQAFCVRVSLEKRRPEASTKRTWLSLFSGGERLSPTNCRVLRVPTSVEHSRGIYLSHFSPSTNSLHTSPFSPYPLKTHTQPPTCQPQHTSTRSPTSVLRPSVVARLSSLRTRCLVSWRPAGSTLTTSP
jgi:hypothetical protein